MQAFWMAIAGFLARLYYRVERMGAEVPEQGPVLLVGNHPNGLVDPVLVAGTTPRPVRFLGKAPLFDLPVLGRVLRGLRVLPVYRSQDGADTRLNRTTFEAVHAALGRGEVLCIFPEGRSHDEPGLGRLKTGASRMVLGAEALHGFELGVRIVPVGLVYRAKRRFRSPVATWVGPAISATDLRSLYRDDERAAVRRLTARIEEGLRRVTLELDRWEDLGLLEMAERLAPPDERDRVERLRAFARGVRLLRARGEPRVEALAARLAAFRGRLQRLGIPLEDLGRHWRPGAVVRFALTNLLRLAIGLPLALLGAIYWAPPYLAVPRWVARLHPQRDVHATYQILAGVVAFGTWWAATGLAIALLLGPLPALLVALVTPPLGLFALAFWEWRREVAEDVHVFLRLALRTRLHQRLLQERDAIARDVEELRAEVGADDSPPSPDRGGEELSDAAPSAGG